MANEIQNAVGWGIGTAVTLGVASMALHSMKNLTKSKRTGLKHRRVNLKR